MFITALALGLGLLKADPYLILQKVEEQQKVILAEAADPSEVDYAKIRAGAKAIALNGLEGIILADVQPEAALAWMEVCVIAERFSELPALNQRFATSSPDQDQKFKGDLIVLRGYAELKSLEAATGLLKEIAPETVEQSNLLLSRALNMADQLQSDTNTDQVLALIETAFTKLQPVTTERDAQELINNVAKTVAKQCELLNNIGRTSEALQKLDFEIQRNASEASTQTYRDLKAQLEMVGQPFPELTVQRKIGNFESIAKLKGKVLVLASFAQWQGKPADVFATINTLTNPQNNPEVAIIGITQLQGFFGRDHLLSPDDEFNRMKSWVNTSPPAWPIVFLPPSGLWQRANYVVINRDGTVRWIGKVASDLSKSVLRAQIQAALNDPISSAQN
jgi:hypothetical protein